MTASILVTGGAGYIGSHVVLDLLDRGWRVVVLDDLSNGLREMVPDQAVFVHGDAGDVETVTRLILRERCLAVMHFAGSTVVPESVSDPLKYYLNNTATSRNLLSACITAGVRRFIFSSTAAVYGNPARLPMDEDLPPSPITPYGTSKLMTEAMLRDVAAAHGMTFVALRYFNVAGADPRGRCGQCTPRATHLIKVACEAALGLRDGLTIFGEDYPTQDGTCIRDYIHVTDLAAAHSAALEHLMAGGESLTLNCGYGWGISVRQVVAAVERLSGRTLNLRVGPRRDGDPAVSVADNRRIRSMLDWTPRLDDVDAIVGSALAWEQKRSRSRMGTG